VYIGSVIGIVLSFVLAWLLNLLKLANTASQEAIEGFTALLAVLVLYYVSNWMLSKSESDAWNAYIKDKTKTASEKGSYFALAFTAFLAVFREGAEVVLFYQPYIGTDNTSSAIAGFVFGAICLVFVYLLINFMSLRIPLKPFFTGTSILMFLMSISFLGAGIKELMEGDIITSITSPDWLQWIPYNDVLDVLGIYPILETLIPQLILLVVTIVIFVVTEKKNRRIHAEAEARRTEERKIAEAAEKERAEREFKKRVLEVLQEGLAANETGELEKLILSLSEPSQN
jgi:high-affinity iron transporter